MLFASEVSIPFRILCGEITRELRLSSRTSWMTAKQKIAGKMEREPAMLRFVYVASWEVKGNKEPPPSSLGDAEEWEGLLERVSEFTKGGKGGRTNTKAFYISVRSLTDVESGSPAKVCPLAVSGTVD